MADISTNYQQQLDGFESALPNQVGAVFAINGEMRGMDSFDHPATLARLLPKLVQSYALDAIDQARMPNGMAASTAPTLKDFMKQLRLVAAEPYSAIGLGTDLRFDESQISGGALTGDEQKALKTTAFDLQLNPANPGKTMKIHHLLTDFHGSMPAWSNDPAG